MSVSVSGDADQEVVVTCRAERCIPDAGFTRGTIIEMLAEAIARHQPGGADRQGIRLATAICV